MTPEQIEQRAMAVLSLIESDLGQSGRDVRFLAIRDELVDVVNMAKDEDAEICRGTVITGFDFPDREDYAEAILASKVKP